MNITLWVITALLALAFLAFGTMKLTQPRPKLIAGGQGWAEDATDSKVKVIGVLEILAAVGLILPALLHAATVFVPLAATGLAMLMLGAGVTHARRREYPNIAINAVLGGLALFVAISRFGAYSF